MKKATIIILTTFLLIASYFTVAQTSQISGTISSDTTWSSNTVQLIGNVTIPLNVKLTISPGVVVQSQDYYRLNVTGSLFAEGTESDSIIFTVADTTGFFSNYNSVDGAWDGIHIIGDDGSTDKTILSYCRIEYGKNYDSILDNTLGGVICANNYGTLQINNSLVKNNISIEYSTNDARGGAVYCEEMDTVSIINNRFEYNLASYYGGAISIDKLCKDVVISNNYFIGNSSYVGAAIHSSDLTYGHIISDNYCFNNMGTGNGVIYTSNPYGYIYNNIICNNQASGIFEGHQLSTTKIFGNTIVNNYTTAGAIVIHSRARVYNNICWGNKSDYSTLPDQINVSAHAYPLLEYNCVQTGYGGKFAVYENPEFTDPTPGYGAQYNAEDADWSLLNNSPCINTGTEDTSQLYIPENDIVGNQRIFGNRIDIGAIENQVIYVGADEVTDYEMISFYPNPASDYITLSDPNAHLQIHTLHGQHILTTKSGEMRISLEVVPAGVYIATIKKNEKVIKREKLIVK